MHRDVPLRQVGMFHLFPTLFSQIAIRARLFFSYNVYCSPFSDNAIYLYIPLQQRW